MARVYNEKDLAFYTEIEVPQIRVDFTNRGRIISWNPILDVEGYAVYKGNGRAQRVKEQRYLKVVVLNTHNHIHNKSGYYPSRENVSVAEIEVYVPGLDSDYTDTLPITSFTSSSSFNSDTGAREAFSHTEEEEVEVGWQSGVIQPNPFKKDELHEWIMIDFVGPIRIEKVRIKNGADSIGLCGIHEYRIETSIDGLHWTPLHQGKLERVEAFQDVDLSHSFYKTEEAEDDWQLVETVGSITNSYLDGDNPKENADYRVKGIVIGDISFEGSLGGTVDLKLTGDFESVRQDITNRLRSQKGQWKHHKDLGSNLELLEGMKNTRETASYGTGLIEESLLSDGRLAMDDLKVRPVPKSISQVDYYVIATSRDKDDPIVIIENMEM